MLAPRFEPFPISATGRNVVVEESAFDVCVSLHQNERRRRLAACRSFGRRRRGFSELRVYSLG